MRVRSPHSAEAGGHCAIRVSHKDSRLNQLALQNLASRQTHLVPLIPGSGDQLEAPTYPYQYLTPLTIAPCCLFHAGSAGVFWSATPAVAMLQRSLDDGYKIKALGYLRVAS